MIILIFLLTKSKWFIKRKLKYVFYGRLSYFQYLQMLQLKYHQQAEEKGIHIVGACGFDSVPADVGLEILREKFQGKSTLVYFLHCYVIMCFLSYNSIMLNNLNCYIVYS